MNDKKALSNTALIVIAILGLMAIFVGVAMLNNKQTSKVKKKTVYESTKLYFVTEADGLYGVSKSDGTVIIKPQYDIVARVGDTVYLKSKDESFMFFLNDGKNVNIGGKESEVVFAYTEKNQIMPYFILRFGESEENSLFRIYGENGERFASKDFSKLSDVYDYLKARQKFTPAVALPNITNKYNVISTITYPSVDGSTQYIVTKKDAKNNKLMGIVDSKENVLIDFTYSKISTISGSDNFIYLENDDKCYLMHKNGKMYEIEKGFEIQTDENYIIQKKGNTVNKVYNLKGEIVIEGIYKLSDDFVSFTTQDEKVYMLVQEKKNEYTLYNIIDNKKEENAYSNVIVDYMDKYDKGTKNTSFIYSKDDKYMSLDLSDMKTYNLNVVNKVISPLDIGTIYSK